jgi:hypothetical protein
VYLSPQGRAATAPKPVALLLADLGVTKTHARPHVSGGGPMPLDQRSILGETPLTHWLSALYRGQEGGGGWCQGRRFR